MRTRKRTAPDGVAAEQLVKVLVGAQDADEPVGVAVGQGRDDIVGLRVVDLCARDAVDVEGVPDRGQGLQRLPGGRGVLAVGLVAGVGVLASGCAVFTVEDDDDLGRWDVQVIADPGAQ